MRIVYTAGEAEIIEKKSRFIGKLHPVSSEEEALAYLEEIRKKHYDARHHCWAYVIGDSQPLVRSSDDGEPAGTAGHPMLDILQGEGIHNGLIVVTRYFGGTLLGTGGLVRAYSGATKAAIKEAVIVDKQRGIVLAIDSDYNSVGKIQYLMGNQQIVQLSSSYTDAVRIEALVPEEKLDGFQKELQEATGGKVKTEQREGVSFAMIDGKVEVLT